tara:strand:- start:292 stop:1098 length:807 start_codon:yes stop_codon:yes gene_type:complete
MAISAPMYFIFKLALLMDYQVQEILSKKTGGVYCFSYNDECYWLKAFGEDKNNFVRKSSNMISKLFKSDYFKNNASSMNMNQRIEFEKKVIKLIDKSSSLVPNLIKEGDGYFVTKDSGTNLKNVKKERLNEGILNKIFQGLMTIHRMNVSHGRPAMRDILLSDSNEVVFIDFEEASINPSAQLKARDFMLLIIDLESLGLMNDLLEKTITNWLKKEEQDVIDAFLKLYNILNKAKILAKFVLIVKPKNNLSYSIIKTLEDLDSSLKRL